MTHRSFHPTGHAAVLCTVAALLAGPHAARAQNPTAPVQAGIQAQPDHVYLHQTFLLHLSIRTSGIRLGKQVDLLSMPQPSVLDIETFEELPSETRVRQNTVEEIRHYRCRARALSLGQIKVAPVARVRILTRERLFFGSTWRETPRDVLIEPATLQVRPLPESGRPDDFSGAVGQFDLAVEVEPQDVAVGDLVKIVTRISGQGYLQAVKPPQPGRRADFKVYEPKLLEADDTQRVYEQVFIPQSTNATMVPSMSFSFFDPSSERYRKMVRGPFPLTFHRRQAPIAEQYQPAAGSVAAPGVPRKAGTRLPHPEMKSAGNGGPSNPILMQARQAYEDGYFDAVIAALEAPELEARDRAPLLFNLANAYFHAGRYAEAILNFERARALAPRDAAVRANLGYVRRQLGVPERRMARPVRAARLLTPQEWLVAGAILLALAMAGITIGKIRRCLPSVVPVASLVGMLLCFASGLVTAHLPRGAAIAMRRQHARFAPTRSARTLFEVPAGATVQALERADDWLKIDWAQQRGWVLASDVQPIDAAPAPAR